MKTLALIALLIGAPFAAAAEEDPTGRAMSGVWSTQKLPSEKFLQMGQELIVDNEDYLSDLCSASIISHWKEVSAGKHSN